jgi:Sulfotransferase family
LIGQPTGHSLRVGAAPASNKIKFVFILGAARSGSTLLGRLLGHVKGCFYIGELKDIWTPLFEEGVLCGCGTPFKSCPFWTDVFRRAFGGMENVDTRMKQLRYDKLRQRWLPLLLWPRISRKYREDIHQDYCMALSAICRAAHEVSECRVLIDSSKYPQDCIVLNHIKDFDLHVIHLVRDSRAVANSWLRRKQRPQFVSRTVFMPKVEIKDSAREWLLENALSEALRPCLKQCTRVYYEDLVADPWETLTRICSAIGEPIPTLDFLEGHMAHLGKGHTVAGNPIRFQEGPVHIKPDMEWVDNLSKRQKALVCAYTWPLMMTYGYFRRGRRSSGP